MHRSTVGSLGKAVSYERGTPVAVCEVQDWRMVQQERVAYSTLSEQMHSDARLRVHQGGVPNQMPVRITGLPHSQEDEPASEQNTSPPRNHSRAVCGARTCFL
jgi:hypothetical protein